MDDGAAIAAGSSGPPLASRIGGVRRQLRPLARQARFVRRFGPSYLREGAASGRSLLARARDVWAGFHPNEADWYRQIRGHTRGVLTNRDRETALHGLNGHYAYVLDNKALFAELMRARQLATPRVYAVSTAGRWRFAPGGEAALAEGLRRDGRIVVKPTLGSKGRSIRLCRSLDELDRFQDEDAIATSFVVQAPYAHEIHAATLNTIRILMMRDAAGRPVLAAAMHRFGTAGSGLVDNFSAGGLVAKVDVATGTLDRAVTIVECNAVRFLDAHPDTGAPIAGVVVPGWDRVHDLVEALGDAFPELVYVGWDVAMTEAGPTVIEGNAHPSLRFFQFYDTLLDDPRVGPLFRRIVAR